MMKMWILCEYAGVAYVTNLVPIATSSAEPGASPALSGHGHLLGGGIADRMPTMPSSVLNLPYRFELIVELSPSGSTTHLCLEPQFGHNTAERTSISPKHRAA